GVAFSLTRKLLALNDDQDVTRVEVILLSRNSADTGLRVFNSIEHYGLGITRAAFTNGSSPWRYVPPFGAHLFLSADQSDVAQAREPLPGGPFKRFLAALHALQAQYPAAACPIRTALVTARGAPAHERVIRTLRSWDIRIDEALFLGGLTKAEFLRAFGADI